MKRLLLLVFTLASLSATAQFKLKKADRLFRDMAYTEAAKVYEDYLKNEKNPTTSTIKDIADCYYYIGKHSNARQWYAKLYKKSGNSIDDKYFNRYIQTLRIAKEYDKADELLLQRLKSKGNTKLTEKTLKQMRHLDSIKDLPSRYNVNNIRNNTAFADFGTSFYGERIVYSSAKNIAKGEYAWNEQPYLELYIAERDTATGNLLSEEKFMLQEQTRYHNATLTFTPDLKTVYFSTNSVTKNDRLTNNEKGTNNIQIIKGTIEEVKLSSTEPLPFNSVNYSVGHPALSGDGKWLFFVSDMPGGYGETDIYVVEILTDGKFGKPKNLGPEINTPGREMFPFLSDSILYFSSDRHYGLGGLDVFESTMKEGFVFTEPVNLGEPVNSNLDDFGFVINESDGYGYLSSNRKKGKGGDDIYYFRFKEKECSELIAGKVSNTSSNDNLEGATVAVYNERGNVVTSAVTNDTGEYALTVPCDSLYKVEVTKPGFTIVVIEKEADKPLIKGENVNFELTDYNDLVEKNDDTEKIAINPIYFDFDKWDITTQAAAELDRVVYVMKNFPDVVIKIESHTDSRGNDNYNSSLSQNRAQSTYSYITSKGIDKTRIESVKGYGESQLINKCDNDVPCTEEEHQMNRRSEFIIVKSNLKH